MYVSIAGRAQTIHMRDLSSVIIVVYNMSLAIHGDTGQESSPTGIFEASWRLLRGFGQAFVESWVALWGAFGAS